uniref:SAM-dependent MTase RsmB/NOP-type domain-containing protein n=1 Tax=Tetradesmus obliquus TaxID=3088 RepID=A0A383VZZ1_TETOB|eukprot:jgi/Sobl393_1/2230/SZX70459.1
MNFNPSIVWDPKVKEYFGHAFGAKKLQRISESLCRPSLKTCLRVNTLNSAPQDVVQQLQQLFPGVQPYVHPVVSSAVIVPGRGELQPDYEQCGGREVVINRLAGEAVLKGAHVFSPGLLAASRGLAAGDAVAVTVALERRPGGWAGVNRGATLTQQLQAQLPGRLQLAVGVGRITEGRRGLFRQQQGLAVEMLSRVYDIPACNGVLRGQVMLQALPCIVAAQVLDPAPGSRVLDMCAAPGGKTSMLAQVMGNSGTLVALDRTAPKVQQVQSLAADWGADCITAMVADATQLYQQQQQQQLSGQPLRAGASSITESSSSSLSSLEGSSRSSSSSSGSSSSSINTTGSSWDSSIDLETLQSRTSSSSSSSSAGSAATLSPEVAAAVTAASFDSVLLDAPCSALGLRPRLLVDWTLPALQKLAAYQRALLHSAVHCLKPGGHLVYCTCTINPGENEEHVRYVLDRWPQMRLVQQPLLLGGPGLVGPGWLTAVEAQLVQRFDPVPGGGSSQEEDTMGFFIAKFKKTGSTTLTT